MLRILMLDVAQKAGRNKLLAEDCTGGVKPPLVPLGAGHKDAAMPSQA